MPTTTDILIIGGGIMGAASAYFLASALTGRRRITVLEPDPAYTRASTPRATGVVRQQYGVPENIRMSVYASEFLSKAPDLLAVNDERAEFGWRERDYVWLVEPHHKEMVLAMNAVQRAEGADVAFLEPETLGRKLPRYRLDGLAGGSLTSRGAGWLDPWGFLQSFRRKAISQGVTYVADRAAAMSHAGRRIETVTTAGGLLYAPGEVVNCAGAMGAAKVAAMVSLDLPVEPRKRSAFLVDCQEDVRDFPMTILLKSGTWFRPEGKGILCGVAPKPENDPATEDDAVDFDQFDEVVWPAMAEVAPALEAVKVARAYAGHYDFNTLDENAILGRVDGFDNFLVATGYSGHGVMQAPATGRAIMELIVHGRYVTLDLSRFGYGRIVRGEALPEPACF